MKDRFESPIILLGARFLSPYIMLFGLYVIFHGHYSPGGGFQGGALLAASVLLIRLAGGRQASSLQMKETVETPLAAAGVLVFFATGFLALLMGGHFLDYGKLPGPDIGEPMLRYYGILVIEVGIGAAVMAILVMIFDNMINGEDHD